VLSILEDAKAEDVVVLDVAGKTCLADMMVIASGRSNVHVSAIADRILKDLKEQGRGAPRVEGLKNSEWVLLDVGNAIVHVFKPETRRFYNLEKLWGDDRPREQRAARPLPA